MEPRSRGLFNLGRSFRVGCQEPAQQYQRGWGNVASQPLTGLKGPAY